jgi:hypothetical protein
LLVLRLRTMRTRLAILTGLILTAGSAIGFGEPASALSSEFACNARGVSLDQDPTGLVVREKPSAKAKVVGKIYSAPNGEPGETKLFGPELSVHGYQEGWLLVSTNPRVTPSSDPTFNKPNYFGAGWVAATKVRGLLYLTSTDSPHSKAYADSRFEAGVVDPDGNINVVTQQLEGTSEPVVVGCARNWLQLTYRQSGYFNNNNKKWVRYSPPEKAKRKPVTGWLTSKEE